MSALLEEYSVITRNVLIKASYIMFAHGQVS